MNRGNTSSDFLISAELVAGEDMRERGVSLSALPYYGPVTLKESAKLGELPAKDDILGIQDIELDRLWNISGIC